MHILCIFLYDNRFLEDFLEVLVEEEIEEVFVTEAEELKELLAFRVPVFKELQVTLGRRKKECKLILAIVESERKIEKMVRSWKEDLQLEKEEVATIFSFPAKVWHISPHIY